MYAGHDNDIKAKESFYGDNNDPITCKAYHSKSSSGNNHWNLVCNPT